MEPSVIGRCSCCGKTRILLCAECSEVHVTASQSFEGLRLCVECNRTFEAPMHRCPSCLSSSFIVAQDYFLQSKKIELQHSYCCLRCDSVFRLETSKCCPFCSNEELVSISELIENTGERNDSKKSVGEVSPFRPRLQAASKGRSYREIG